MELHLGSLSKKVVAETNGAKLWEKLHDLIMKQRKEIEHVCEELGKLAPSTVGPLRNYLLSDKVEDMLESVFYDLLREGTPLSEKDQHELKDFYGLNEATSAASPGWKTDQKGTHYKTYLDRGKDVHPDIEGYVVKRAGAFTWSLHVNGTGVASGPAHSLEDGYKKCDEAAKIELEG